MKDLHNRATTAGLLIQEISDYAQKKFVSGLWSSLWGDAEPKARIYGGPRKTMFALMLTFKMGAGYGELHLDDKWPDEAPPINIRYRPTKALLLQIAAEINARYGLGYTEILAFGQHYTVDCDG